MRSKIHEDEIRRVTFRDQKYINVYKYMDMLELQEVFQIKKGKGPINRIL